MNPAAAALVASAAKSALAYVRADQTRKYGLLRRACVYVDGPGVGKYHFQDTVLGIISPTPNTLILTSEPFPSNSDNWNGPDLLPDTLKDGSFGMSLWHDLIVKRVKEIAAANGATEQEVFEWANGLVQPLMRLYAQKPPKSWWTRTIYNVLEAGRPIYHPLKKLLGLGGKATAVALLCISAGCKTPPDWVAKSAGDATAIVWQLGEKIATNAPAAGRPQTPAATGDGGQSAGHGPASASGALVFKYGGFDGSRAVEDPAAQIADLHITRSRLSYRWAKGGCETLGATSKTDAEHTLACAFYWDGSRWVGGKFDWISTSRTSRDFNNLNGGYNGWVAEHFWAADRRAFCIVSKDGKKRTNLLVTEEPR